MLVPSQQDSDYSDCQDRIQTVVFLALFSLLLSIFNYLYRSNKDNLQKC